MENVCVDSASNTRRRNKMELLETKYETRENEICLPVQKYFLLSSELLFMFLLISPAGDDIINITGKQFYVLLLSGGKIRGDHQTCKT